MKRRELLLQSLPASAAFCSLPLLSWAIPKEKEDLLAQVSLLREMDNDSLAWIWGILNGITEEELDWKINDEANSIRWIVGHLTWFEEWASDAIEEKGLYLIDKQPSTSFQSDSFDQMKDRLTKAHEKYDRLVQNLNPEQIRRPSKYLYNENDKKRADVDLRTIMAIRCTHFFGHLYQIRMIRGTYSRVNNTDKAAFDKW
ncbi:DinB family protein [Gramella lutea]|uniref:DinB family protein n=1 Tax=Christiangramia lutea TaxID=1607951 RepID=A0A9X1V4C4_9FLAO|nr:DinB family protein [Christiangramia lutea]MCH4824152.1 DinB family protein [Christiangramia lutea]